MLGFNAGCGSISRFIVGGAGSLRPRGGRGFWLGLVAKNPNPHRAGGEPRSLLCALCVSAVRVCSFFQNRRRFRNKTASKTHPRAFDFCFG